MAEAPKKRHILLVEDNARDVRLVREVLDERGLHCNLYVARDGEQALRMLRGEIPEQLPVIPDLVLLDISLPILSGIEVLQQVKTDPKLRHIPVLILTTSKSDKDILQCYSLHANSYLVKPADFEEFSHMLAQVHGFWLETAQRPQAAQRTGPSAQAA